MGPKTAGNSHADCPGTNALRGEKHLEMRKKHLFQAHKILKWHLKAFTLLYSTIQYTFDFLL